MAPLPFLLGLVLWAAAGAGDPDSATHLVDGTVVSASGDPVAGILIFAVDPASDAIVAVAGSDDQGHVQLQLRQRPHNFGVMSARYGVQSLIARGQLGFSLVVRALPDPGELAASAGDGQAPVIRAPRAILIRGQVLDEGGHGLAGVRVDAVRAIEWGPRPEGIRATGMPIATAISGENGVFVLAIPGGDTQLQARAPGLQLVRSAVRQEKGLARADRPVLVMGVATAVQNVVLSAGHVLRVRLKDSIDPEYSPPAAVRAWLLYAYGICASALPFKASEKEVLKKYWYLDLLRQDPPNPATVNSTACTPPALYGRLSLSARTGLGAVEGFAYEREQK